MPFIALLSALLAVVIGFENKKHVILLEAQIAAMNPDNSRMAQWAVEMAGQATPCTSRMVGASSTSISEFLNRLSANGPSCCPDRRNRICLLYTFDAADAPLCVVPGASRRVQ